jgi:hypothetical protein
MELRKPRLGLNIVYEHADVYKGTYII